MSLSFRRLDVYKSSTQFLALAATIVSDAKPGNSSLLDQLRRAATSVMLNIAEATGRAGKADVARTYAIARGSAMECAAVLDALKVLQAISDAHYAEGDVLLTRSVAMLTRLCR